MAQQDIDIGDAREDWKGHLYTGHVKKRVQTLHAAAVSTLRGACSSSSDPHVRGALERVKALESALELFEKGVE
jgi:hypothetical protein